MNTEITTHDPPQPIHPLALLQSAIQQGMDPDKLGKLMDLAERHERNRAAEGYAQALAEFQSQCPTVFKHRTAEVPGKFSYKFASYDDVMAEAGPILAQCKLAVSFSTEPAGAAIKCTCRVRWGIHVEETVVTVPVPAMSVNDTQRFGAAVSYAKRFAICAALNIVVTDEDDDAQSQIQNITATQAANIHDLIAEKNVNIEKFLEWAQAARVEDIPAANYAKVEDLLRRKAKNGGAK